MERNAFINGRNIWSTWGAELMDGALEAILEKPLNFDPFGHARFAHLFVLYD